MQQQFQKIVDWQTAKPPTDIQWAEDIKKESFDLKFDKQLLEMKVSLEKKLPFVEEDLDKFDRFPDAIRYELEQQFKEEFSGQALKDAIEDEFKNQHSYYRWKVAKINQSVERIEKEEDLRKRKKVSRNPIGTTFYIDPVNGTDTYTGTKLTGTIDSTADSTHFVDAALTGADDYINNSFFFNETTGKGTLISDFVASTDTVTLTDADSSMAASDTYYILHAFLDLDQFTENSRSAGDIVIIRRGGNQMDDGTDLCFTSDGTIDNPIVIEADYGNNWRDDVDLSVTATATLTFGSKTITFSADVSSVVSANDWIYVATEEAKEFAYEVDSVSTDTITLFLSYKGDQAGSSKTMTNMQASPIWNTAAGNFQWFFNTDNYWKAQGIHIRGTDSNGNVGIDTCGGHVFKDCIFEGNGSNDTGIKNTDDRAVFSCFKSRFFNHKNSTTNLSGAAACKAYFKECLFDCNTVSNSSCVQVTRWSDYTYEECEFKRGEKADIESRADVGAATSATLRGRNLLLTSTTQLDDVANDPFNVFIFEDHDAVLNDTRQYLGFSSADNTPIFQSETSTVRSGGSTISIKVTPSTQLSTNWELSRIKLFDLPFYATTSSKTYTVYFASADINEWTANPIATELWIELEYWGHASNNFRRITKSTGTVDFKTDADFDQTLTVTVTPSQTGVVYLRCYYAKTKESGKNNIFFADPIPEVS